MFKRVSIIAAAALFLLSGLQLGAQGFDSAKFDEAFMSLTQEMEITGTSVIVLKDNAVAFSRSFGENNISVKIPFTGESLVKAGEASRVVISIAVMQLADDGRVNLDGDVSRYLGFRLRNPDFPDIPITLRMLLTHTASLAENVAFERVGQFDASSNPDAAAAFVSRRPGSKYLESPAGYILAAAVVEKVTGDRFDEYAKEHIFGPLGTKACYDPADAPEEKRAKGYIWSLENKGYIPNLRAWLPAGTEDYIPGESTFSLHPEYGLIISAEGIAKLVQAVMQNGLCASGKRLYSAAYGVEMLRQQADRKRQGLAFRYNTTSVPDYVIAYAEGDSRGMSVCLFFNRQDNIALIAVCNGAHDSKPDSDGVIGNHFNREMRNLFIKNLVD